jgi:hypothetical protein
VQVRRDEAQGVRDKIICGRAGGDTAVHSHWVLSQRGADTGGRQLFEHQVEVEADHPSHLDPVGGVSGVDRVPSGDQEQFVFYTQWQSD